MGKKTILFLIVALVALAIVPAIASADLVNEYGMHFAGQSKCLECHDQANGATVHGRMARSGLFPDAPSAWTMFKSAGDATPVAGTKGAVWNAGGSYTIGPNWVTLGDNTSGLSTEYLFWKGDASGTVQAPNYGMPWNLVEGLTWAAEGGDEGEWVVGESPTGLYDVVYGCQRCHQLGTTSRATNGEIVPNPAAVTQPGATTAMQWARDASKSVSDFMTDPTVSQPGMSIQCEACHGTGVARTSADAFADRHWNSGTQISNRMPGNDFATTLGRSQVCGQCHGSFTPVFAADGTQITLGTPTGGQAYGYTPNLPLRNFVDVNGVTTKADPAKNDLAADITYTTIPTEAEFLAHPTWYWMFPNGSNAKGGHYYYDEWQASGHSWRGALSPDNPDASAYQKLGHSHYSSLSQSNIDSKCYKCHTGEGYLYSKNVIGANSESGFLKEFSPTASNTGFMGQECTTCHGGHPASLNEADVVREPDKAGQRSAAGLTVDNQSICEDCHNWQMEVQGLTPVYKPIAALSGRGGPSHPQRETLHGRIMVEIPAAAGDFMPGAKCEDCHMPKTNKGANRISHGMKPMLPGEAETWNAAANAVGSGYMGEDSCSKCHGGETRDGLQANIDRWQDETTAAAADAAAAITAAQTRSEFSLTDPTNPGYILSGRATWNYKSWQNDASTGVHNPEYILAGLEKATQLADSVGGSFAIISAPESVLPGTSTFVSGKIVNGDGSGAAGATVKLYANGVYDSGNVNGAIVTSAGNGTFAFLVAPNAATTYTVVWQRSSVASTNLTSPAVTVNMAKYASTTTIAKSASSVKLGKSFKISGTVSPAAVGATVKLQWRKGTSGSWKSATLTLNASSGYSKKFTPGSKGTWYYKATFNGTSTIATSKTGTIHVHVK